MLRSPHAKLLRRAVTGAAVLAVGAAAAPATSIAASTNACLYSYDQEWRELDFSVTGSTTAATAGGTPIADPTTRLTPGDKVTLTGGTLNATLPKWVAKFGADNGWLTDGDSFPVSGWITLDATNTAERAANTTAIPFTTTARVDLAYEGGDVSEEASVITTDPVVLNPITWTATGGTVRIGQAYGDTLGPLPVGRNGTLTTPEGSLAVSATIGDFTLTLECLPGITNGQGAAGLVEYVPPVVGQTWNAPAYTGVPASGPFIAPASDRIDAEFVPVDGPRRAAVGTAASFSNQLLEIRLTPEQRAAWLGADTPSIGATFTLAANDATPATQTVTASGGLVAGTDVLRLAVAAHSWTRSADKNVEIKPTGPITVTASGKPNLTLTPAPNGAGAFARIHESRATVKQPDPVDPERPTTTNPPQIDGGGNKGFLPPPPIVAKPDVATFAAKTLKPKKNKLSLKIKNPRTSDSRVRVQLRTSNKLKIGKKKKFVSITSARTTTLKGGKTTTLKLTLSRDARTLLRRSTKVKVKLTVTPVGSTTTKAITKTLTLRR